MRVQKKSLLRVLGLTLIYLNCLLYGACMCLPIDIHKIDLWYAKILVCTPSPNDMQGSKQNHAARRAARSIITPVACNVC